MLCHFNISFEHKYMQYSINCVLTNDISNKVIMPINNISINMHLLPNLSKEAYNSYINFIQWCPCFIKAIQRLINTWVAHLLT